MAAGVGDRLLPVAGPTLAAGSLGGPSPSAGAAALSSGHARVPSPQHRLCRDEGCLGVWTAGSVPCSAPWVPPSPSRPDGASPAIAGTCLSPCPGCPPQGRDLMSPPSPSLLLTVPNRHRDVCRMDRSVEVCPVFPWRARDHYF